jgi:hypothetical protein
VAGAEGTEGTSDEQKKPWWKRSWTYVVSLILLVVSTTVVGLTNRLIDLLPHSRETRIFYTTPYDGEGNLYSRYHVAGRFSGHCLNVSVVSGDPESHRCFTDKEPLILDPCWYQSFAPFPIEAACLTNPWSHDVSIIRVKREDKYKEFKHRTARPDYPWGFELKHRFYSKSTRCEFVPGATAETIAGERVNYHCYRGAVGDDKRFTGVVAGSLRKLSGKLWEANFTPKGSGEVVKMEVAAVWV